VPPSAVVVPTSVWLRGRRVSSGASTLFTHGLILTVTSRRQRPVWMTSGIAGPVGGLLRVNLPLTPVTAVMIGLPDWAAPQVSQATGGVNGCTVVAGM
jgi:hypothetical protein